MTVRDQGKPLQSPHRPTQFRIRRMMSFPESAFPGVHPAKPARPLWTVQETVTAAGHFIEWPGFWTHAQGAFDAIAATMKCHFTVTVEGK